MLNFLIDLGNKITEEKTKGINLYHLLHYVWLIELYFLMLNSLSLFITPFLEQNEITELIPSIIHKYNADTITLLQLWSPFILFMGVGMFVSSIFVSMSKYIPFTKNSGVVLSHADAGIFFSKWLLIIALTYYVYTWTGEFLPLVMILLVLLTQAFNKIRELLESRYDITFR